MRHIMLIVLLTFCSAANIHAASLLNISSWGYADHQSPHIACSIISGSSSERVLLLVYAEANLSYNNRTDPEVYIGRPGNPLVNPSAYVYEDDWSTSDTSAMIRAVGRTPNNHNDSGVFISAPPGPICIYAYELNGNSGTGRMNAQLTFLGNIRSAAEEKSSKVGAAKIEKASQADILSLFSNDSNEPVTKISPADSDIVTTAPDGLN